MRYCTGFSVVTGSPATRFRSAVRAAAVVAGLTSCMPRERINASCEWKDSVSIPSRVSSARRKHIEEDVRVAQDLGIRYGDSLAGRLWYGANRDARESCTNASLQSIMRQHAASRAELDSARGARVTWPDLLLVFAPMLLLFALASYFIVRSIASGFDADDRLIPIIILIVLTPIAALLAVGIGQVWSGMVEEARLRTNHLSYRFVYLPFHVYKPVALVVAAAVFAVIAARYRRYLGSGRKRFR